MSNSKVTIEMFDTTLRDGAQSLPIQHQFPEGSKAAIAAKIATLGIGVIEAGFPRTPGDGEEVSRVAKTVGNNHFETTVWQDGEQISTVSRAPVIAGLCRTTREDIEAGWEAVKPAMSPRIHTFISTDPEHMAAKFPGKSPDAVLAMGVDAVKYARRVINGRRNGTVEFSAEAATTTDTAYLERVVKSVIDHGADVVNLPDTVGQRDPFWMYNFYTQALHWISDTNKNVVLSAHNHNDIDMSTANSIALVQAAANHASQIGSSVNVQVESTICGLGERAGNADIFPFAAGLFQFAKDMPVPIVWEFNPVNSYRVAREVMSFGQMDVHRQNPIVGDDINTHRSGIHADGVIKGGPGIYTPQDAQFWGHSESARFEEGKYQGKAGNAAVKRADS